MDYIYLIIIITLWIIALAVTGVIYNALTNQINKIADTLERSQNKLSAYLNTIASNTRDTNALMERIAADNANKRTIYLTIEQVDELINARVTELWQNKYLLYYTIKEVKVIPNMDTEIENFVTDVLESFGDNITKSICDYYTKEYLVRMITRRAQILMVDYINTHKPIAK